MATMKLSPKQINQAIAISVTRLLAHYPTGELDPTARQLQIEDWLGDLREFGAELVEDGCGAYRRGPDYRRRPLPGDIRKLCIELQAEHEEPQRLDAGDRQRLREERADRRRRRDENMAREGREIGTRWAQERGYPTLEAYATAKGINYATASLEVARSIPSQSSAPAVRGFSNVTVGNYTSEIIGGGFTEPQQQEK